MTTADLRAALLLAVVFFNTVEALPLPRSAKRENYEKAGAQDEIARWQAALARLGLDYSPAQLTGGAFALAESGVRIRKWLTWPARPIFELTQTGQNWALFTHPDRWPARLVIEAGEEDDWRRLYASLDPEHDFRADALVYRRVRAVYDGQSEKAGRTWDRFASWAAAEVFAAYPEVDTVRVKFIRVHTFEPGESATVFEDVGDRFPEIRRRP